MHRLLILSRHARDYHRLVEAARFSDLDIISISDPMDAARVVEQVTRLNERDVASWSGAEVTSGECGPRQVYVGPRDRVRIVAGVSRGPRT